MIPPIGVAGLAATPLRQLSASGSSGIQADAGMGASTPSEIRPSSEIGSPLHSSTLAALISLQEQSPDQPDKGQSGSVTEVGATDQTEQILDGAVGLPDTNVQVLTPGPLTDVSMPAILPARVGVTDPAIPPSVRADEQTPPGLGDVSLPIFSNWLGLPDVSTQVLEADLLSASASLGVDTAGSLGRLSADYLLSAFKSAP